MPFNHEKLKAIPFNNHPIKYLHYKLDGHRVTFLRQYNTDSDYMWALTRNHTDLWPQLTAKAKRYNVWSWLIKLANMPPGSSIDGELYVPGGSASDVKTAIKNNDPALSFSAFAVPYWAEQNLCYDTLQYAMGICSTLGVDFTDFLTVTGDPTPEKWLASLPADYEGYVGKLANYYGWYKLKRQKTLDAIVTKIEPGKGKYEGMCGSLVFSVYTAKNVLVEIGKCSGMTDEQRKSISESDLGRVLEVSYQNVASLGRLRHPSFVQWREDKTAKECTVAQDVVLLRKWG